MVAMYNTVLLQRQLSNQETEAIVRTGGNEERETVFLLFTYVIMEIRLSD